MDAAIILGAFWVCVLLGLAVHAYVDSRRSVPPQDGRNDPGPGGSGFDMGPPR